MKGTKVSDVMTTSVVAVREDARRGAQAARQIRYVEDVVGVRDRLSYPEEDT